MNGTLNWAWTSTLPGVIAALVGVYFQAQYDRRKERHANDEKKNTLLRYWREELEYNVMVNHKMKGFLGGKPLIDIWSPLAALALQLR